MYNAAKDEAARAVPAPARLRRTRRERKRAAQTTHTSRASAAQTRPAQPAAAPDLVAQIEKLKALHDKGALTDEEFSRAKAKLLDASGK